MINMKLCKTLLKYPPKGERSFYRFLLITGNPGNTYVENLSMSNFICLLLKMWIFLNLKFFMQIIWSFFWHFLQIFIYVRFSSIPYLGMQKIKKEKNSITRLWEPNVETDCYYICENWSRVVLTKEWEVPSTGFFFLISRWRSRVSLETFL